MKNVWSSKKGICLDIKNLCINIEIALLRVQTRCGVGLFFRSSPSTTASQITSQAVIRYQQAILLQRRVAKRIAYNIARWPKLSLGGEDQYANRFLRANNTPYQPFSSPAETSQFQTTSPDRVNVPSELQKSLQRHLNILRRTSGGPTIGDFLNQTQWGTRPVLPQKSLIMQLVPRSHTKTGTMAKL